MIEIVRCGEIIRMLYNDKDIIIELWEQEIYKYKTWSDFKREVGLHGPRIYKPTRDAYEADLKRATYDDMILGQPY